MDEELIETLKEIKKNVDAIEPFDVISADKNCDLKWTASGLLFDLIEKLKTK